MGRGGDAGAGLGGRPTLRRSRSILDRLSDIRPKQKINDVRSDLTVLKNIWFKKLQDGDHKERLEAFYGPQAHAYDRFRSNFLWGRRPMLAACAARLQGMSNMVWVDLGGGTGENVEFMAEYMDLRAFKAIYVVDLCGALCKQAEKRKERRGWKNVHVIEADACEFAPPEGCATLVTFSYSLSMIPPFYAAVDRACSYLDREEGLLGVTDFFVSSKYDLPMRQMPWLRRFFWRSTFDTDNIDIGPERRNYLDHQLSRVWEYNDEGSIPYVPFLRAPYYVWIGRIPKLETLLVENKVEAPALFPPTFLYTQSWEDPVTDEPVIQINEEDVCLTLTSGGCNSLNLCISGAKAVYSVDCNPAQSALLELKQVAIRQLDFEDVWALFGEGKHPHIERLFESRLAPFLSQASYKFWRTRLHYFREGLYYQGGMGKVVWYLQAMLVWLGMGHSMHQVAYANTLEEQKEAWEGAWFVQLLRHSPLWLLNIIADVLALLFFNRITLWFGGGIPMKQYQLIQNDGVHMASYAARTFDGVAQNSHVRKDNWFYFNCLTGKFARDCCPAYLKEQNFALLKAGAIDRLHIVNGFYMDALTARKYSKANLMDSCDWLCERQARELAAALGRQIVEGGKVIWRSASLSPPYAKYIEQAGFEVRCLQRADQGYMDRVNMYSSFFVATKKASSSSISGRSNGKKAH
ncbi:hypothetical protein N2152v2_007302 [Parachlorella kessleri]